MSELATTLINQYGIYVVIVFALLHPLLDQPWSFITMSAAFHLVGVVTGFILLITTNLIGIIVVYIVIHYTHKRTNQYFQHKKVSKTILKWLEETPLYKHIVVIGLPLVPTWPIKISMPLSNISFIRYVVTITLSYVFLYSCYTLVYFGVFQFQENNLLAKILLILFVVVVYFGRSLFNKLQLKGE